MQIEKCLYFSIELDKGSLHMILKLRVVFKELHPCLVKDVPLHRVILYNALVTS